MDLDFIGSAYAESPAEEQGEEAVLVAAGYQHTHVEEGSGAYRAIVRWTLMIGVFLVPIFFLPWTTNVLEWNKTLLVLGVAGVGLIAWLLGLVSSGKFTWRANAFDKGVLAVLGAALVATIFSMSQFNSLFGAANTLSSSLMMVLAFTVIYFLIVNSAEDEGRALTEILRASLIIALLFGLLQIVGIHIFKSLGTLKFTDSLAFNSAGSVDGLGVLAAISLPLLGGSKRKSWFKYFHIAGMVAGLAILVILNWWVLWTIAIVGMAGWIIFESLAHEQFSISRFILPMTVIVIGVFLMVVNFNLNAVKSNLPVEVAPSYTLSAHVAKSALQESLITGYGPANFSLAFDKYGASQIVDSTISSARFPSGTSEIFGFIVGGGILAILALLVMFWSGIQGVMRYIRDRESAQRTNAQSVWAALCAVGAAFLLYPFNMTLMFMAYLMLALAVLALWGSTARAFDAEDSVPVSLVSSLGFIGGLILVLVGAYFGVSAYVADAQYGKALTEPDITKASADLVGAINWNGQSDLYYRTASQAALGLLSNEIKKPADKSDTQRQARIQNYMSSAVNLAKKATDLGPRESLNWDNLGNVYQSLLGVVGGVDSLSAAAYQKAAQLRPGDPAFYNEIGSLYLTESQILQQTASGNQNAAQLNQQADAALALAETNFKKAVDMSGNYGLAIYNLGVVYDQEGKLPDAIKQLEKIAPFNNDQPSLLFELGLLYYRNGNKDKAFNTLQQVLVLEPNYSNALWYLALIYEERKDIPNAIAQLQKILSIDANKNNQTVLDKLQQLQAGQNPPTKGINQKPL
jgi:tetratricopeptide (TPR) repeat protein